MWDRNVPSAKYGFAGMLTAPRRVFIQNGALCQDPIVNCAPVHKATVANKLADNVLTGVITIKATGVTNFHLKMRCDGVNATTLGLIDGQGGGVSVPSQASKSLAKKGTPTHLMEFAVCPSPTKGT
ncbi:MAG: hypothetical protein IJX23_05805 [Clostridia bacterium]|nr:hypothetical protein [Clostridia bacterium]